MKISLSPDLERLIAEKVGSGRYHSADEVVREGLELLDERENEARIRGHEPTQAEAIERAREIDPNAAILVERVRETNRGLRDSNGTANLAAAFESIASDIPDKDWESIPADLSKNLDHYLYGGQKTS